MVRVKKEQTGDTIFTYLNALFYKNQVKYDKKIASAYILLLWLSHDKELIGIVNEINKYLFSMTDEQVWQYLYKKIPKGRRFIKWTKKDEKTKEKDKEITELIEANPRLSKKEAKTILQYRKRK